MAEDAAAVESAGGFEDLVREHHLAAFHLAVAMLGDRGEAEDAVQSAALLAWRHLDSLRSQASGRAWFLAIVANRCRTVRRRPRWWLLDRQRTHLAELPGDCERALDVRRAIARLPYGQRLVVVLRYYLDLPFADVGAVAGITEGAARARAHRALEALAALLARAEAAP